MSQDTATIGTHWPKVIELLKKHIRAKNIATYVYRKSSSSSTNHQAASNNSKKRKLGDEEEQAENLNGSEDMSLEQEDAKSEKGERNGNKSNDDTQDLDWKGDEDGEDNDKTREMNWKSSIEQWDGMSIEEAVAKAEAEDEEEEEEEESLVSKNQKKKKAENAKNSHSQSSSQKNQSAPSKRKKRVLRGVVIMFGDDIPQSREEELKEKATQLGAR